ncbi:hypothetical protein QBC37DRAFT_403644 [Rhypophila decipiens]|uniref:Uncharacterized protein n=1 Tax=Rhypophila decipiens TaxID=261697 RepID=A0AAN6Y0J0_9PEZI|nr:hypothetical protein QBC37DRAFT_403644 [Rhypophila decipiens]
MAPVRTHPYSRDKTTAFDQQSMSILDHFWKDAEDRRSKLTLTESQLRRFRQETFKDLDDRIDGLEDRIGGLEENVMSLFDHDEISGLKDRIVGLERNVSYLVRSVSFLMVEKSEEDSPLQEQSPTEMEMDKDSTRERSSTASTDYGCQAGSLIRQKCDSCGMSMFEHTRLPHEAMRGEYHFTCGSCGEYLTVLEDSGSERDNESEEKEGRADREDEQTQQYQQDMHMLREEIEKIVQYDEDRGFRLPLSPINTRC